MEPRLGSRGKVLSKAHRACFGLLQWSRDLEVAESGACCRCSTPQTPPLQWSRDLEVAERRPGSLCRHCPNRGFNGAATWKSRKVRKTLCVGRSLIKLQWSRDLEVAESVEPLRIAPAIAVLQWSRDLEVAERRAIESVRAFMPKLQWSRDLEVAERSTSSR